MTTAVEGGHVEDIDAANRVIREIIEARNASRGLAAGPDSETLAEETDMSGATPLPDPPDADDSLPPSEQLLTDALKAIRDRRPQYGHPKDHFARTIGMINSAFADKLKVPFEPSDWPLIMILDKIARHLGPRKRPDSPIDICGYASLIPEVEHDS